MLLSIWLKPVAECVRIELGSISDICVFKIFVIEKLLLFGAAPKFMFALIWCWFIIPADADVDGMFWIWFDIGCANGWTLGVTWCSADRSILQPLEFLTCGAWLWVPVWLMIRPCAVMQRARHVVKRYDRLEICVWFVKKHKRERKCFSSFLFCLCMIQFTIANKFSFPAGSQRYCFD